MRHRHLSEIGFGEHLCSIHETVADQRAFSAAAIKHGVAQGACCLYVVAPAESAAALEYLANAELDVADLLNRGALKLIHGHADVAAKAKLGPKAMIEFLLEAEAEALRCGFHGVRLLCDMTGGLGEVIEPDLHLEYELLLNVHLSRRKATVFCQHRKERADDAVLHDAICMHSQLVIGQQAFANPFRELPEIAAEMVPSLSVGLKRKRARYWLRRLDEARRGERAKDDAREAGAGGESKGRYRRLIESLPHIVWMADIFGRCTFFSSRGAAVFGLAAEAILDDGWLGMVHADDQTRAAETWKQAVRRGNSYESEYRLRVADGSYRWFRAIGAPVLDRERRIRHWVGTLTDIDEWTLSRAEHHRTHELLKIVSDTTSDAVFIKDRAGKYLLFNRAAADFVGKPVDDVIGRDDTELFLGRDAEFVMARDRTIMDSGVPCTNEEDLTTADGVRRVFLATKSPYRDAAGQVVGLVGISRDITDWRRSEAAAKLRDRAMQAMSQGIVITDPNQADNPIIFAGAAFERITGYQASEVVGRNCRLLQGDETDRDMVGKIAEAVKTGRPCEVELINYRKDGTKFWNQLYISPVHDDVGTLTHFIGVLADVTARRTLEEQLRQSQKMEAAGRLAGGIAHDFNNLLTIISGSVEILLESTAVGGDSAALLNDIKIAADRSAQLTRQLLVFSRKQIVAPRHIDLNQVILGADRLLRRIGGEDVELVTQLEKKLLPVKADPGQIEQVIINLVVNARDAMPTGGKIVVETTNMRDALLRGGSASDLDDAVVLSITDTGIGMTDEVRARAFEPFFTTKGPGQGTGLGLAVVHGIVEQSGGRIEIQSELGKGTTFKILLPAVGAKLTGSVDVAEPAKLPRGSETILLVEDDAAVCATTSRMLASLGYRVLVAENGAAALRVAKPDINKIDLLLTDVVMPKMGGQELVARLTALRPGIPVIYQSDYTDNSVIRHDILESGASFLQKPFSRTVLAHKLREVLDERLLIGQR